MRYLLWTGLFAGALAAAAPARAAAPDRNARNGVIKVPAGFCARVFARNVGALRHLVVAPDGTVYAVLSSEKDGGGVAVLRDTDGDGTADSIRYFGDVTGTGIALHDGYLYVGENTRVVRFRLLRGHPVQPGRAEVVIGGFPEQHEHSTKSLAFGPHETLYVGVGAPSNACQKEDRVPGSPGIDPCPLLERHGGIWRFKADRTGQKASDGTRYATGLRNMVAIAWNDHIGALYGVMMGRDQLHGNWPALFTAKQSAELPAEEFLRIDQGADYGWPYCYYDGLKHKLVLAPEYGGNGTKVGRCGRYAPPLLVFPAHWAPEAMLFYRGDAFPAEYRNGAFVAFHGSWNRAPLPQKGFVVAFVPFGKSRPSGPWRLFATGFAGPGTVHSPGQARFRPVGVAEGPHGALYIADSQQGWIWRVTPEKTAPAAATQEGAHAPDW